MSGIKCALANNLILINLTDTLVSCVKHMVLILQTTAHHESVLLHATEDGSGQQALANIQHVSGLNLTFHSSNSLLAGFPKPLPIGPLHLSRDNP